MPIKKINMKWLSLRKDLKHMFPQRTWHFHVENTLFLKEGALFPEELGPFLKGKSLFLKEVAFFLGEIFLLHGEFVWDWHLVFFSLDDN
jgi:hypothetical protein